MKFADKIFIEDSHGGREHDLISIHAASGSIFLNDHISSKSAMSLVSLMKYMAAERKDVTLYINSSGGEVNAGLLMYDMMQAYPYGLDVYCVGMAASMAAVLLAGGRKGRRFILPHSKVLIHEPLISDGFGGSATNIEKQAQQILDVKSVLNGILAKHTGKPINEINQATAYNHLMTAEEAVAFGICDEIKPIY